MEKKNAENPSSKNRREFLKAGGAITAGLVAQAALPASAATLPALPSNPATPNAMPTRNLGKTGYKVGIFSLGGQAAIERADNEAIAVPIIEKALDLGVNYIDTSSIYGGPQRWSERYVGQVMKKRRSEAFLASKTRERTKAGSLEMLEQSLKLLNTDHLDLWQLHDIGSNNEIEQIFAKGGAMEALLEARDQKMVRFLGITGHFRPEPLIEAIHRYPFDTILMAVNAADPHHFSFSEQLLPLGGGQADGHHRHEGSGARPYPHLMDTAAHRAAETFVGRYGTGAHSRHARHAAGDVLLAVAAGFDGDYRLRFSGAVGTQRGTCARVHAIQRETDGVARAES